MLDLAHELTRVIDDARSHGLASIDLHALDRLVHRHHEARRRDLLDYGGMLVVPLDHDYD